LITASCITADFEWDWPKKIDRELIERALTLDFISEPRNLILLGANGLGKTMIAKNEPRRLPGPVRIEGATLTGDGWTVTVARGWTVRSGPRSVDYQIIRDPQ
jgi:hypothetical protein